MSYLHLPLTDQIEINEMFSDMPPAAKAYIRGGFSVLVKIPEATWPALLQAAVLATGQRKGQPDKQLASALGLSVEQTTSVVAALGMLAAFVSSRSEPPEGLIKALVDAEVITEADASTVVRLIPSIVDKKPDVRRAVHERELADSVLPSFSVLQAVVDVRIGSEELAGLAVPVAIAHLTTDARERRLWFQLTKDDVQNLIQQLNSLLDDFKKAEELIGRLSSSGGA